MTEKYKLWFFIMPIAFLAGIFIGGLSTAETDAASFLSSAAESLASPTLMQDSFLKALLQNGIHILLFCIFGTTIVGAVPSAFLLGLRGFGLGQTVGVLVSAFGFRGLWASSLGIFPHNLLYVPLFCLLSVFGAGFSTSLLLRNHKASRTLVSYSVTFLLFAVPILLGCLIEGYVSAPLLRNILLPML